MRAHHTTLSRLLLGGHLRGAFFLALAIPSGVAIAAEPGEPAWLQPPGIDHEGTSSETLVSPDAVLGHPIAIEALEALRGGADTVENDILVNGNVQDNTADHVVTGHNNVDAGSFANANGISTVIQNTGANVLIQNAMIVNVQFAPPPSP